MAVFNDIERDGRVQRAAEALSGSYAVTVMSLCRHPSEHPFRCVGVRVHALPGPLKLTYFSLRLILKAVRMKPDVVFVHDYYLTGAAAIVSRLCRVPVVYDAHELSIPGRGDRPSRRRRFFYKLERCTVREFDLVIAANEERAAIMQKHYAMKFMPLVVRNISPLDDSTPLDQATATNYQSILQAQPRRHWLVYEGWISESRHLDMFVSALALLDDRFGVAFVGEGPGCESLRGLAESVGVSERVVFFGAVPRQHLRCLMSFCRIGLISYPRTGLNNVYCAPNKVFEYAQAGLPVLVSCQPPLRRMVAKYGIGATFGCRIDSNDHDTIFEIAGRVLEIEKGYSAFTSRLTTFVQENLWDNEAHRLVDATSKLNK